MTGKRMGVGRRLPALALDAAFVVFLFALVVRLNAPADLYLLLDDAEHLSGLGGEWQSLLEDELSSEAGERIEGELQHRWDDLLLEDNPAAVFNDPQLRSRMYRDVVEVLRTEVSPEVYPQFDALAERTAVEISRLTIPQLVDSFIDFLSTVLLPPLTVVLVYWASELLLGWSLGKRLLHLQIAALDGGSGNLGLYFSRFLFRHSALILLIAGLAIGLWWLLAAAAAGLLVITLGSLRMLGGDRRALHDVLSGTAVIYRPERSGQSS